MEKQISVDLIYSELVIGELKHKSNKSHERNINNE